MDGRGGTSHQDVMGRRLYVMAEAALCSKTHILVGFARAVNELVNSDDY